MKAVVAETSDATIRKALIAELSLEIAGGDLPLLVEELGLCQGEARVDVAVFNGSLHGYEIKSDIDTLDRLEGQQVIYSKTLDFVTLVIGNSHACKLSGKIPSWWGVSVARQCGELVVIEQDRESRPNPSVDPFSLVQLLWRDEALSILRDRQLHRGVASKPRQEVWARMAETIPLVELKNLVHNTLKNRSDWRSASQLL